MDLIDKQDRLFLVELAHLFCFFDHLSDLLDPGLNCAQTIIWPVQGFRDQERQGSLSYSWRTPENHGWYGLLFYGVPQHGTLTDDMLLTNIFSKILGTHPLGQRYPCCHDIQSYRIFTVKTM
ncbi:Uncharacterised protein [Mycobacterium tuberculosis]|nr:Uncharacterised protein [Mycobacterium tuberculosis]